MTRDRRFVVTLCVGIVLIPLGVLVADHPTQCLGAIMANVGLILVVVSVWAHSRRSMTQLDTEHARAPHARAVQHAWIVTLVAIHAVFWLDYTDALSMTGAEAAVVLAAVMLLTTGVLRRTYRRAARARRRH